MSESREKAGDYDQRSAGAVTTGVPRAEIDAATPRPWRVEEQKNGPFATVTTIVDANGHRVVGESYSGDYSYRASAEFDPEIATRIVRAVNCHDELVSALYELIEMPPACTTDVEVQENNRRRARAQAALSRAKDQP
jgi:hypothetical protein